MCQRGLDGTELLIEPIWNRNSPASRISVLVGVLLIEPIWNRNVSQVFVLGNISKLLIEPIWNRNFLICRANICLTTSFNRTNME